MRIKYLLFIILLSLSFICISNVDALTTTKVNVYGGTNIRNNTSNGYKNIIKAKYMDNLVIINNKAISAKYCSKGLIKVKYNNIIGYVCSDSISSNNTVLVKAKTYLRNGKGTNYKAYKKLSKNTMLTLKTTKVYKKSRSCSKGWYKVLIDGTTKYICKNNTKRYTDKNTLLVTSKKGAILSKSKTNRKYTSVSYMSSLTLYKNKKYSGKNCPSKYYRVKYNNSLYYVCSSSVLLSKTSGVVVSNGSLTVRSSNSSSSKQINTLYYGNLVGLINTTKYKGNGCSGGFYKIYLDGRVGYACSNFISTSNNVASTNKNISIKENSNSNSKNIGLLNKNINVALLGIGKYSGSGCSSGYYKITYDNRTGYICSGDTDFNSGTNTSTNTSTNIGNKKISSTKTTRGHYYTISNWTYRINEDYAYARTSPTGSVKDTLYLGTELDYLGESGKTSNCAAGWYKVKYFTNKTGYVCKTYVDKYNSITKNDSNYCKTLTKKGFPSSYCPYLSYIHSKHPKWVFKSEKTGVKFINAVNGESLKNYTQNTKSAYLYSSSIAEAGGWRVAGDGYVGFMIDPRNYLNEKNIFAFEDLGYDSSYQTKSLVRAVLKGTWLDNDTYAGYFVNAGKASANKISPIHLAARVKQEGGSSKSYSGVSGTVSTTWNVVSSGYVCSTDVNVSGNKITVKSGKNPEIKKESRANSATYTYANGRKITANSNDSLSLVTTKIQKSTNGCSKGFYKVKVNKSLRGIYNFYNIGAYGSNPVVRGLAAAAGYVDDLNGTPWNTYDKAIYYGANFIAKGYINKGQNTLFYQKFNVGPNNYFNKYTHQYMTNILAPASESLSSYRSYSNMKVLENAYSFKIPVYDNMPSVPTTHPIVK